MIVDALEQPAQYVVLLDNLWRQPHKARIRRSHLAARVPFQSCTGVQSVGVKAQRERHCLGCLPHPSRSQSGNTIANVGLRHGLEIVEICRTRFRHPVVRRQDDLCRDTANSGRDGCDGDRIEDSDGRIACEDQHGTLLVWCLEGVPADVSSIQGAPQSCSPNQRSNSFGATGLRA